jgi:hypothetical protein
MRSHTKGCDETPINTGFEGATSFVILRLLSTTWVEARHYEQRFTRHFIKNLKSIPIYFDVDSFSMNVLSIMTPQSYIICGEKSSFR